MAGCIPSFFLVYLAVKSLIIIMIEQLCIAKNITSRITGIIMAIELYLHDYDFKSAILLNRF